MYYLIGFLACTAIKIPYPIVNIKNYKYLVNGELLNVFPSSIPENVIDTRLTYSPALLQAGDQITLYYIDNNLNFMVQRLITNPNHKVFIGYGYFVIRVKIKEKERRF